MSVSDEEHISGKEVHFVFRMEKLAGKLGEAGLLSRAAWERLSAVVEARPIGDHPLPGFETPFAMYSY